MNKQLQNDTDYLNSSEANAAHIARSLEQMHKGKVHRRELVDTDNFEPINREHFEKWAAGKFSLGSPKFARNEHGDYRSEFTQGAWEAWATLSGEQRIGELEAIQEKPIARLQVMEDPHQLHPHPLYDISMIDRERAYDGMDLYAAPRFTKPQEDAKELKPVAWMKPGPLGAQLRNSLTSIAPYDRKNWTPLYVA